MGRGEQRLCSRGGACAGVCSWELPYGCPQGFSWDRDSVVRGWGATLRTVEEGCWSVAVPHTGVGGAFCAADKTWGNPFTCCPLWALSCTP